MSPKIFPETSWTLIEAAHGRGDEARTARAEFARRYHPPIYAFLVALLKEQDAAEDLAQSFFADKVETGTLLRGLDQSKGAFRPYLKEALRNFAKDWWRKQARTPQGDGSTRGDGDDSEVQLIGSDNPERNAIREFDKVWVLEVIRRTLDEVQQICEAKNQFVHFSCFTCFYLSYPYNISDWEKLSDVYKLKDGRQARNRAMTVFPHIRESLRRILGENTQSETEADDEIAFISTFLETLAFDEIIWNPSSMVFDQCTPSQLKAFVDWATAPLDDPALLLAQSASHGELCKILNELSKSGSDSGDQFLATVCAPDTSLGTLHEIKELSKTLLKRAGSQAQRSAATMLYHGAIAASLGRHGINISSRPIERHISLYENLAIALAGDPLGPVFTLAVVQHKKMSTTVQ